jgi:ribonuclease P protein component
LYDKRPAIHHSPFSTKFGVGVSNKNFKKAVHRNRIKRLTREGYRLQKQNLCDLLIKKSQQLAVFFIYTGRELPEHSMVNEKIGLILLRLIKIANEINPPNT